MQGDRLDELGMGGVHVADPAVEFGEQPQRLDGDRIAGGGVRASVNAAACRRG